MPLDVSMLRLLSQEQLTTLLRHIPGDKDMVITRDKHDSEIKLVLISKHHPPNFA